MYPNVQQIVRRPWPRWAHQEVESRALDWQDINDYIAKEISFQLSEFGLFQQSKSPEPRITDNWDLVDVEVEPIQLYRCASKITGNQYDFRVKMPGMLGPGYWHSFNWNTFCDGVAWKLKMEAPEIRWGHHINVTIHNLSHENEFFYAIIKVFINFETAVDEIIKGSDEGNQRYGMDGTDDADWEKILHVHEEVIEFCEENQSDGVNGLDGEGWVIPEIRIQRPSKSPPPGSRNGSAVQRNRTATDKSKFMTVPEQNQFGRTDKKPWRVYNKHEALKPKEQDAGNTPAKENQQRGSNGHAVRDPKMSSQSGIVKEKN